MKTTEPALTPRLAHPLAAAARSEVTKFLGLRSLPWLMALGMIISLLLAWLLGASAKASGDNGFDTYTPAPELVFATLQLGQLFFAVAAALCLAGEYSSGTITSTLQAVPVRGVMLASKAIVVCVAGALGGAVVILAGTPVAAASAQEYGAFEAGELMSALAGAVFYLAAMMLMVLGLAALCRNSAGSIVAAFFLLLGLPQMLPLLRVPWLQTLGDYLPTRAAAVLATGGVEPYGAPFAAMVLLAWAGALLAAGYLNLRRRDA